jgi:hypothetical protein
VAGFAIANGELGETALRVSLRIRREHRREPRVVAREHMDVTMNGR